MNQVNVSGAALVRTFTKCNGTDSSKEPGCRSPAVVLRKTQLVLFTARAHSGPVFSGTQLRRCCSIQADRLYLAYCLGTRCLLGRKTELAS